MSKHDKRMLGQYFTVTNPFDTVAFYKWVEENAAEFEGGGNS